MNRFFNRDDERLTRSQISPAAHDSSSIAADPAEPGPARGYPVTAGQAGSVGIKKCPVCGCVLVDGDEPDDGDLRIW